MLDQDEKKIIVEVTADGKNFAGKNIDKELLKNTGRLKCSGSSTGEADPSCDKSSVANTTVRVQPAIWRCIVSCHDNTALY
jgi:hypothetical protein